MHHEDRTSTTAEICVDWSATNNMYKQQCNRQQYNRQQAAVQQQAVEQQAAYVVMLSYLWRPCVEMSKLSLVSFVLSSASR